MQQVSATSATGSFLPVTSSPANHVVGVATERFSGLRSLWNQTASLFCNRSFQLILGVALAVTALALFMLKMFKGCDKTCDQTSNRTNALVASATDPTNNPATVSSGSEVEEESSSQSNPSVEESKNLKTGNGELSNSSSSSHSAVGRNESDNTEHTSNTEDKLVAANDQVQADQSEQGQQEVGTGV